MLSLYVALAENISWNKDDGINVAQWLQSIETFIGVFFKLYPMVESRGILEYLIGRLREGHVMELGILRNLLKVSGGYSFADYTPAAQLNKRQLEGRAGSITLQRETMSFGIVEKVNPEAIRRLRRVLQRDGIGARLLVLIAQARDRLIFDSSHGAPKDVKLLGNLYDSCQVVMFILSEFLTAHEEAETDNDRATTVQISSPVEHHSKYLPSFLELTEILGFEPTISWLICRAPAKAARNSLQNVSIDGANPLDKFLFTESTRQSYMKQYPDALWSSIYPMLYEFFFTNELYDVLFPEEIYKGESSRIEKEIESLQLNQAEKAKNAAQIERLRMSFKQLSVDFQLQQRHVQKVISDFDESKSSFFRSEVVSEVTARMFLLHCVYPRSLLSPDDAMYASHFAMMLHNKWTPGFSTMHYFHELISVVSGTLFGVTEAEAANLAILLEQTWTAINRWRYDTDAFQREVAGKPGSYVESDEGDGTKTIKAIDNKIFTEWYSAWHAHLGIALIGCLKSHEYIHTRTALLVLTRLVDVFPTRPALGNKILEELKPLQDEDSPRPDIRAAATAYSNSLIQARDNGKWKEEDKEVAKARADKEKKEAKERKKQQQARMEEMAKDSEKITEKIGPRDGPRDRDRNSDRRRDRDRDFSMRRSRSPSPIGKGADRSHPPGSSFASMASILGAREGRDRGGPERSEDRDRRYPSRDRELDERDRGGRDDDRRRDRDNREYERERIDDRRWPRERDSSDSVGGRNAKRSRPSSPDEGRESDRGSSKRARMESDRYPSSRRNGGRGDSPARRPRSPEQPPPSRSRDAPSRRNR
jgi:THO complex subunit 2